MSRSFMLFQVWWNNYLVELVEVTPYNVRGVNNNKTMEVPIYVCPDFGAEIKNDPLDVRNCNCK